MIKVTIQTTYKISFEIYKTNKFIVSGSLCVLCKFGSAYFRKYNTVRSKISRQFQLILNNLTDYLVGTDGWNTISIRRKSFTFTNLKNAGMKIISIDQVEKKKVEMVGANGAWKQLPLGSKDGAPVYSYRVFSVEPGGNTPYHSHPYEHMNFIIDGQGTILDEAGNEQPVKAGDFALVYPDEKHQYKNTSPDKVFKMICGVPKEFE
jgi:quercetin dioxygenase-like cupin family protein